jgi:hypothetical protein
VSNRHKVLCLFDVSFLVLLVSLMLVPSTSRLTSGSSQSTPFSSLLLRTSPPCSTTTPFPVDEPTPTKAVLTDTYNASANFVVLPTGSLENEPSSNAATITNASNQTATRANHMVIIFVPMGVAFTVIALLWTIYHDCRNRVCVQNRKKKRDLEENAAGASPVHEDRRIHGGPSGMPHVVEELPRLPLFKWTMEDIPRIPGFERPFGRRPLILAHGGD